MIKDYQSTVQAVQYTGQRSLEVIQDTLAVLGASVFENPPALFIIIKYHEEEHHVFPGDYVILYPIGIISVMSLSAFEAKFEIVTPPQTTLTDRVKKLENEGLRNEIDRLKKKNEKLRDHITDLEWDNKCLGKERQSMERELEKVDNLIEKLWDNRHERL